jgi:hypothetical protein
MSGTEGGPVILTRCKRCGLVLRREGLSYVDGEPLWGHTAEAVRQGAERGIPTRHRATPHPEGPRVVLTWALDAGLPAEIADRANAEALRRGAHRTNLPGTFRLVVDGRTVGVAAVERVGA